MKTIRLFYPDHVSGGLEAYHLGARLLRCILPENPGQPLVQVEIAPPDGREKPVTEGIYGRDEVLFGIDDAMGKLQAERPDRIITLGGNCLVSLAPFDYLHGLYGRTGIVWIDAHPDVSAPEDGYPNAHAMVLGALLGRGAPALAGRVKNGPFRSDEILYVGLQTLHGYQAKFLARMGMDYRVQTEAFVSDSEIRGFLRRFDHLLVHLDVDVLDEGLFHSTYFANPELVGDGAGGGRMTLERLSGVLRRITENADVVGFTIAEYLPFDALHLQKLFAQIPLFREG